MDVLIIRRRQWQPTPVLLPRKSHGWRSLVGCGPWDREELDTTERFHFHFSLSCIGEGNCNPLQCSCLENPRDSGAWWAAVYGVTQSRTGLSDLAAAAVLIIIVFSVLIGKVAESQKNSRISEIHDWTGTAIWVPWVQTLNFLRLTPIGQRFSEWRRGGI